MLRSLPRRAALCATLGTATALSLTPLSPAAALTPGDPGLLLQQAPSVAADVAVRPQAVAVQSTGSSSPPQITYSVAQLNGADQGGIATAVARLNPLTGQARTLVADNSRLLTAQAWSDDRFRVYYGLLTFSEQGDESSDVDSVSQAGGSPRRERTGALELDVSRDGSRLVYVREDGGNTNIFTSNAAGGDERRVTGAGALSARFSPDASRIIFTRVVGAGEGQADVFTVRTDGTGLTRVTGRADTDDYGGTFSPDGRRVLFTREVQGSELPDIYSVGIDGRGLRLVRADAADPDWSANGWLTYLTVEGSSEDDLSTQVAIRSPGVPGKETVLTRERNLVTAVRFAG